MEFLKQLSLSVLAWFLIAPPLQVAEKVRLSISSVDVSFLTAGVGQRLDRGRAAAAYDSTARVFSEDSVIPEAGLKLVIDQGREAMKIERPVANSDVAEFNLLREVHKEMGIGK